MTRVVAFQSGSFGECENCDTRFYLPNVHDDGLCANCIARGVSE
jgi:hypothetical protein